MASGLNSFKEMMSSGVRHSVQIGLVIEVLADVDGIFVQVDMGTDEVPITCEQIFPYAGVNFGMYPPISVGDYVSVFIPDGDTCGRPFTLGVMTDETVTIPQDVLDNPDDFWLIMKEGQNVRIRTSGDLNETSIQSKMVRLGSEDDAETDPLSKWPAIKQFLDDLLMSLGSGTTPSGGNVSWGTPLPTVPDAGTTNVEGK